MTSGRFTRCNCPLCATGRQGKYDLLLGLGLWHPRVPVTDSPYTEPLAVTKHLRIHMDASRVWFSGVSCRTRYGPVAVAECTRNNMHWQTQTYLSHPALHPADAPLPVAHCSCGFYARRPGLRGDDVRYHSAEAELYGRVVEHEGGWRAQKQRVLSVSLTPVCAWCGHISTEGTLFRAAERLSEHTAGLGAVRNFIGRRVVAAGELATACGNCVHAFALASGSCTPVSTEQLRAALSPVELRVPWAA
jgi:hypothetical protein